MTTTIRDTYISSGRNYEISMAPSQNESTLIIELADEDFPDRWGIELTPSWIEKTTRDVGLKKTISTFFNMCKLAFEHSDQSITYQLTDANNLSKLSSSSSVSQERINALAQAEIIILVITQTTALEKMNFPVPLQHKPFNNEELQLKVRKLRSENKKLQQALLQNSLQATKQERVNELEAQLIEANQAISALRKEKDQTIIDLQYKIKLLQNERTKTRKAQTPIAYESERTSLIKKTKNNYGKTPQSSIGSGRISLSQRAVMSNGKQRMYGYNSAQSSGKNSRHNSARSSGISSTNSSRNSSARSSARHSRAPSVSSNDSSGMRFSHNSGFKRFDPTAYIEEKRRKQEEVKARNSRGSSRENSRGNSPRASKPRDIRLNSEQYDYVQRTTKRPHH